MKQEKPKRAKKPYVKPVIKSEKVMEAGLMPTCTGSGSKNNGDSKCSGTNNVT